MNIIMQYPRIILKVRNKNIQKELIDESNIFKADFSIWSEATIDNNVHLIIFLTILTLSVAFLTAGLILYIKRKNKNKVINK